MVKERYDDRGFSGGSLERPALQKLLADVGEKKIDVIVVYKVDRLTRSLADFAKLVELFDANGVSFVSVTQSFNTTTSMGRLTLNILLSFAQFEREVTGERIRDKIAASKKKGMWMGGVVPLGYRVEDRALHIVEEHAEIVRTLYKRYLANGSVVNLKQALDAEDIRVPGRIDGAGKATGGGRFSRGHLYKILSNPIYIGQIAHKGRIHPGLHAPIVDRDLWDRVRETLDEHRNGVRAKRANQSSEALLAGKLFDDRGNRMSPTWASKGSKRWGYYVSQATLQGDKSKAGSIVRIPATEIESRVIAAIAGTVEADDAPATVDRVGRPTRPAAPSDPSSRNPSVHVGPERRAEIRAWIERVTIGRTSIDIAVICREDHDRRRVLTVPWTPPSPYRRRQILLSADGDDPTNSTDARQRSPRPDRFASSGPSLARRTDRRSPAERRRARRSRAEDGAIDRNDRFARLPCAGSCPSRSRTPVAARHRAHATDGTSDGVGGSVAGSWASATCGRLRRVIRSAH